MTPVPSSRKGSRAVRTSARDRGLLPGLRGRRRRSGCRLRPGASSSRRNQRLEDGAGRAEAVEAALDRQHVVEAAGGEEAHVGLADHGVDAGRQQEVVGAHRLAPDLGEDDVDVGEEVGVEDDALGVALPVPDPQLVAEGWALARRLAGHDAGSKAGLVDRRRRRRFPARRCPRLGLLAGERAGAGRGAGGDGHLGGDRPRDAAARPAASARGRWTRCRPARRSARAISSGRTSRGWRRAGRAPRRCC